MFLSSVDVLHWRANVRRPCWPALAREKAPLANALKFLELRCVSQTGVCRFFRRVHARLARAAIALWVLPRHTSEATFGPYGSLKRSIMGRPVYTPSTAAHSRARVTATSDAK